MQPPNMRNPCTGHTTKFLKWETTTRKNSNCLCSFSVQFSSVQFSSAIHPATIACFAPLSRTGIENGNNHRPNRRRLRHQKFARIEKPNWTQGVWRGGCSIWTGKIGPFHYVYEYVCVCVRCAARAARARP